MQQLINQPCGYPLSENAGEAASYGPELEISARLSPELTLTMSGTYTHTALTSVNALHQADPALASGTPLLNIPKYAETTSLTCTTSISDDIRFVARINNSYAGESTDVQFSYASLRPYKIACLRVGLTADHWSGYLVADNLTDKHAQLGINTSASAWTAPSIVRTAINQPRTIGLDLKYSF